MSSTTATESSQGASIGDAGVARFDKKAVPLQIRKFEQGIAPDDLQQVLHAFLDEHGLTGHHVRSANDLYENGIPQIVLHGFKIRKEIENLKGVDGKDTFKDSEISYIECEVIPTGVTLGSPKMIHYGTSQEITLYPQIAASTNKVYSGPLHLSCTVKAVAHMRNGTTREREAHVENFYISGVPIIKGSDLCNLHGLSREALVKLGEDPSDPGGYFIAKGEYVVECTENIAFNRPRIYINEGYKKSRTRCEFISKPGDSYQNSDMILIWYNKDDTIMIEIARNKLTEVQIPFFLFFRAMGWGADQDLLEHIIQDYDNKGNKDLVNLAHACMKAPYRSKAEDNRALQMLFGQREALREIVDMIPEEKLRYLNLAKNPDNYHNAMEIVLGIFDQHCLPHIGMSEEFRDEKLKFIAGMIRKTLLVWLRVIPQTDRDSYRHKRVHPAGVSVAKSFKTFFHKTVALPILKRMTADFKRASFDQVNLANIVKSAVYVDDFQRLIIQMIVAGNKSELKFRKKTMTNRLSTQNLQRKNQLNAMATLRRVSATSSESAKQSERAREMRRVHPSALGYICTVHSPPEGPKVGINKQLAISATIAPVSSSEVLRQMIQADTSLINEGTMTPLEISRGQYASVLVNGYLVGYVADSLAFVAKYRQARRRLEVNPFTTIYWDNIQNEVQFSVDIGRLTRPLMIVYNTTRDAEVFKPGAESKGKTKTASKSPWRQGLGITAEDIKGLKAGTKTLEDLLCEQKIEYVSPEEQENYLLCPSYAKLVQRQDDELLEYTHCDIPQSILGITALTAVMGNHNPVTRSTYQTTQGKQTAGLYALNWPYRLDKETFLQYVNETPLIKTFSNKYLFPNGANAMVAIMCYTGYNQEDSLILNKAAVERGAFNGCKLGQYMTELERGDVLGNPDASKTEGLKAASYEKLRNGLVEREMTIRTGDVLIGKSKTLPKGQGDTLPFLDVSSVYKSTEEAIVHRVVHDRNEDDNQFCKVGLRKPRKPDIGDKFSSRAGQKGICALLMSEAHLPVTLDGIRPMFIFNPHGIPSRMTCSQLFESLMGSLCAIKGAHMDATYFKTLDLENIVQALSDYGYDMGYDRMINSKGEYIDSLVGFGPVFYQRLQKFVLDAEYSVEYAMTDAITYQPLDGQGLDGGLRLGEMERDVLMSQNASRVLSEKFYRHSDSFTEYICRCGKAAVVNHQKNIYQCRYCGDNADIVAVPTSWSAKLFVHEQEAMNIGVRRIPLPYTFQVQDDKAGTHSQIDTYDKGSIASLMRQSQLVAVDADGPEE
jgi:DNA-directed RNA polymerase II subunit RPB2